MNNMKPLFNFARPTLGKVLLSGFFALLIPLPMLIREPASSISHDHWIWKYEIHESLFSLLAASGFDVFLGCVEYDFFTNLLGLPLLIVCYFAACLVALCIHRVRSIHRP